MPKAKLSVKTADVNYDVNQEALGICIAAKQAVILWGKPGQGKTSVLTAMAKKMENTNLTTIIASIREPSDFAGLPNIVGNRACLVAPDWAYKIQEHGDKDPNNRDILFFDEISTAVPATQAAMLRVILDKVVGDLALGDHVSIVAAANPTELAADGWDLTPPMANRFVHLNWSLPAHVFVTGLSVGWPETPIPVVDKTKLEKELQEAKVIVSSFLHTKQDFITVMDEDNISETSGAFMTPRSWETAATLYGWCKASSVSDDALHELMKGTLGVNHLEFLEFAAKLDLPDPNAIIADPSSWKIGDRKDQTFSVALSILGALKQNLTNERWINGGKIMALMEQAGEADVAVTFGLSWMEMRPNQQIMIDRDSLKTLAPIFKRMGLMPETVSSLGK